MLYASDTTHWYIAIKDLINGSVRGLVRADSGKVLRKYGEAPWGDTTLDTSVVMRFRFAGREFDRRTGLYYMRNRYYDPQVGRFLSEDPAGILGGLNLYQYAGADPINTTDRFGLSPTPGLHCTGSIPGGTARCTWDMPEIVVIGHAYYCAICLEAMNPGGGGPSPEAPDGGGGGSGGSGDSPASKVVKTLTSPCGAASAVLFAGLVADGVLVFTGAEELELAGRLAARGAEIAFDAVSEALGRMAAGTYRASFGAKIARGSIEAAWAYAASSAQAVGGVAARVAAARSSAVLSSTPSSPADSPGLQLLQTVSFAANAIDGVRSACGL